jgi:hypothetical protein
MGLRQEIRHWATKVKHQKELRMSKFSGIDGGFLTDPKRNQTCHKIPHMWEGRPAVHKQIKRGAFPLFFSEKGKRVIPWKKDNLGIKNPVTTSCWERYRYSECIQVYTFKFFLA